MMKSDNKIPGNQITKQMLVFAVVGNVLDLTGSGITALKTVRTFPCNAQTSPPSEVRTLYLKQQLQQFIYYIKIRVERLEMTESRHFFDILFFFFGLNSHVKFIWIMFTCLCCLHTFPLLGLLMIPSPTFLSHGASCCGCVSILVGLFA